MEILLFFLLGAGVGIFGTLVGIGGGLICVPIFILWLTPSIFTNAPQVVGTSLVIVFLNALSGTFAYIRQKRVFFNAAIPFAIATLPGAFLGSYIADLFNPDTLNIAFGAFLLLMAIIMYWNSSRKRGKEPSFDPKTFKYNKVLGILSSVLVGFLSSIFGIGGGIIHVPLMIYLLQFPTHVATATSHFVLAVSSACGVFSHLILNHIIWLPAISIGLGALIGAQIGAKLSKKTRPKIILLLLSASMFALGIRLILLGTPS
jgi:uncharacterized protein